MGARAHTAAMSAPSRVLFAVMVAVLGLACLAGIWLVVATAPLHVLLDPNEGWNAYFAAATMAGHGPYPDAAGFMTNNYPPLSFYAVSWLGRVTGDVIVAGRIVSLVSVCIIAGSMAAIAARWRCGAANIGFAVLFLVAFLLLFSDYVGMDDPQLFGHALQMAGLALFFTGPRSLVRDATVAALFVLALFVKHNLVALPVALVAWLVFAREKAPFRFAALLAAFGIAGLMLFQLAFGFDLLSRLAAPRMYSSALLAKNLHDWLPLAAFALTATFAAAAHRVRGDAFAAVYALSGLVFGIASLSGAGVDVNAMFDADIAMSMGIAVALKTLTERTTAWHPLCVPALAAIVLLPFVFSLAAAFDPDWLQGDFWLRPKADEAAAAESDIAWLRAQDGAAICQMPSLCFWAGKPASVDVFNLGQQFATGARKPDGFLRLLSDHRFGAIQFDALSPSPFPPRVQGAILRNYKVARTNDDGVFLIPR